MAKKESKESKKERYQAWAKRRNVPGAVGLVSVHAESADDAETALKSMGYIIDGKVSKS